MLNFNYEAYTYDKWDYCNIALCHADMKYRDHKAYSRNMDKSRDEKDRCNNFY